MNAGTPLRRSQWWVRDTGAGARAPAAGWHAGVRRKAQGLLRRLRRWFARPGTDDPLAVARSIEIEMPNLAAELRCMARRLPVSAPAGPSGAAPPAGVKDLAWNC